VRALRADELERAPARARARGAAAVIRGVSVLYVDPRGPYPSLVEDWWDETRNAKLYEGPWPVVAHPPCGPWGRLAHLCTKQDASCAVRAVEQVRRFGGVLEHPYCSRLFRECGLPLPAELPNAFGGRTIEVCQVDYGHVARKRTWLYLVGITNVGPIPPSLEPTHWVSGGRSKRRKGYGGRRPPNILACSAQQRRRTPRAFAEWLVSLAASARRL
jgi:hypothetical protein